MDINDTNALQREAYTLALDALHSYSEEQALSTDDMHNLLTEKIVELLSKNPERLMSILYRIDVDEMRINDVIKNAPIGSIASRIAALVIERMEQKARTRRMYGNTTTEEES